jgi:hypothetical protein
LKRITLLVRPDGTSVVEAAGWSGADCRAGTEFLETALGQRLSERLTPEFYAAAESEAAERLSEGSSPDS